MQLVEYVLARARMTNLVASYAQGVNLELLRPELQRHALGIYATEQEIAWFRDEEAIDADEARQLEAMLALAWTLQLVPTLGPHDPSAYGPVQDLLDDRSLLDATMRDQSEIRAMLASIEQAEEDACLRWRRRALRWVLGDEAEWPSSDRR